MTDQSRIYSQKVELPEPTLTLDPPFQNGDGEDISGSYYTADQMTKFGQECMAKALEAAAKECESQAVNFKSEPRWSFLTDAGRQLFEGMYGGAKNCAAAIRNLTGRV